MKKIFTWTWGNLIKPVIIWIWKEKIGIVAIIISFVALQNTREQFNQTSQNSEKQFKLQYNTAKTQFDSISNILTGYQQITSQQLQASRELLNVARQTARDQLLANRPYISIYTAIKIDTTLTIDNQFAPKISIPIKNNGFRECSHLRIYTLALGKDYPVRHGELKVINTLAPGLSTDFNFFPKLKMSDKNDFYLYVYFEYFDKIMKRNFEQEFYFHYKSERYILNFFDCTVEEIKFLSQKYPDYIPYKGRTSLIQ